MAHRPGARGARLGRVGGRPAGHGGRPLAGDATAEALGDGILAVHPEAPDVLIGHSLGTVTALALVERDPGWARTVVLEEPPSALPPEVCLGLAASITADVAAVRADRARVAERVRRECPRWAEEDVYWAVQGIAEMDPEPFARRLRALAAGEPPQPPMAGRILAAAPAAHVLAGRSAASVLEGGTVLGPPTARRSPEGCRTGTWSSSTAGTACTAMRPPSRRARSAPSSAKGAAERRRGAYAADRCGCVAAVSASASSSSSASARRRSSTSGPACRAPKNSTRARRQR